MILSVLERVVLLGVLPQQGDITTLRVLRDLTADLSFSDAEVAALGMKSGDNGQVTWDGAKAKGKEIAIPASALGIITRTLKDLSESAQLNFSQVPVYDRFVDGRDENGSRPARRRAAKARKK